MSREGAEAQARARQMKLHKADYRAQQRQAALRKSDEPLALAADLEAAVAERDRLIAAIRAHRRRIETAGNVLVVLGRQRAKFKHQADHALWSAVNPKETPGTVEMAA